MIFEHGRLNRTTNIKCPLSHYQNQIYPKLFLRCPIELTLKDCSLPPNKNNTFVGPTDTCYCTSEKPIDGHLCNDYLMACYKFKGGIDDL